MTLKSTAELPADFRRTWARTCMDAFGTCLQDSTGHLPRCHLPADDNYITFTTQYLIRRLQREEQLSFLI